MTRHAHDVRPPRNFLCGLVLSALLISGCSWGTSTDRATTETTNLPTNTLAQGVTGAQVILQDVTSGIGSQNGGTQDVVIQDSSSNVLTLTEPQMLLVSFNPPPITTPCYREVSLRLWLIGGSGETATVISSYPSALVDPDSLRKGSPVGYASLLSNKPRSDATVSTSPGWIQWDITDLTRMWASGDQFADTQYVDTKSKPVVVALRSPVMLGTTYTRQFSSTEGTPDHRPSVQWTSKPGCTRTS